MKILIKAKDPHIHGKLEYYSEPLSKVLYGLKKEYRFKLPDHLTFRTVVRRSLLTCSKISFARAGHTPGIGYWVAIHWDILCNCPASLVLSQIAHEAAHIAEARKTRRWVHDALFFEMKHKAENILKLEIT